MNALRAEIARYYLREAAHRELRGAEGGGGGGRLRAGGGAGEENCAAAGSEHRRNNLLRAQEGAERDVLQL
jgi:hypothetical protein